MAGEFDGRQIVVTGGTGALGGAVLARLIGAGAICHVPSSRAPKPGDWPLGGDPGIRLVANVDLADAAAVEAFYADVPDLWASIHLAGGFAINPIEKSGPQAFAEMMDANAKTAFLCCRAAARAMLQSGTAGRIVNVASRPAIDPRRGAGSSAYAMSKAAVAALTAALAEELKGAGILVNAIAPSTLDTQANRDAMPKADFSKWVGLDAAAATITHLVSPLNVVASGTVVALYGRA
jgi:NAD(P)-dependent dehydrogenase (short-subunit alcohol dehydrogenase family)